MIEDEKPSADELLRFLYLTPIGIVKFNAAGAIDLINPKAVQLLLTLRITGLVNLFTALASFVPELAETVRMFAPGSGLVLDHRRIERRADGVLTVFALSVQRVDSSAYMALIEDITTVVAQERTLAGNARQFNALCDNVRDYAIYTISNDGMIGEWNLSLRRFGGWEAGDVQGRSASFLMPSDAAAAALDVAAVLADATRLGSVELEGWVHRQDGSRIWGDLIVTPLTDGAAAARGFLVVARDMTERKRAEDDLQRLATIDPLTGAFNRRHGTACMSAQIEQLRRTGQPLAALILDIDHFKSINDQYGHAAGDAVLCALMPALKPKLREFDTFARWGGEEFLVVLPGTRESGAMIIAERLRETIAALHVPIGAAGRVTLTISIGVAVITAQDAVADADELMRRADEALYAAKTAGRNRVVLGAA